MTRTQIIWLGVAALIAVAGFFAGRSLHSQSTTASAFELNTDAYQASSTIAGLSKAGFSGFTEGGAEGRTVVAGRVVAVTSDSITLEGQGGQRSTLRLAGGGTPGRLEASTLESIRPGVTVLVRRTPGSDEAAAFLVIATQ
jgi:hypothetical protein